MDTEFVYHRKIPIFLLSENGVYIIDRGLGR